MRKDRESRGGGVALLFKEDIHFSTMPDVENVEALWCNVHLQHRIAKVGVFYQPPNADCTYLESLFDYMHSNLHGGLIVLAGDFNLPDIDWCSFVPESKPQSILLDLMFDFNLEQSVGVPTLIQGRHPRSWTLFL